MMAGASSLSDVSLEERLCAAAFRILSDGRAHSLQAQAWALRILERCTPGHERTSFVRAAMRRIGRAFA